MGRRARTIKQSQPCLGLTVAPEVPGWTPPTLPSPATGTGRAWALSRLLKGEMGLSVHLTALGTGGNVSLPPPALQLMARRGSCRWLWAHKLFAWFVRKALLGFGSLTGAEKGLQWSTGARAPGALQRESQPHLGGCGQYLKGLWGGRTAPALRGAGQGFRGTGPPLAERLRGTTGLYTTGC